MYDNTVTHCLKCGGKLKHVPNKKRKMYCSVSCKNGLHQLNKRALRPAGKPGRPKKVDDPAVVREKVKGKPVKALVKSSPAPKKESKKTENQYLAARRNLKNGSK